MTNKLNVFIEQHNKSEAIEYRMPWRRKAFERCDLH
jgi:hypothetical protein